MRIVEIRTMGAAEPVSWLAVRRASSLVGKATQKELQEK